MNQMNLSVILKAVDLLSGPLRTVGQALDGLAGKAKAFDAAGDKLKSWGGKAMMAGGAMGAAAIPAIAAFQDLERASTRAEVAFMQVGGATDALWDGINKKATDLGNKLPGTTADFMRIAAALKEQGIGSQAIADGALEASSYLKVLMGNLSPETAAEYGAQFSHGLGIAEKDFVKFIDVVQRAKFAFGVDPGEFAYTAKYIGPLVNQLGMGGLEGSKSLLTLAGSLSQVGIKGETLGTSLRQVFQALPDLDKKIAKHGELGQMLGKAGIEMEFFKDGQFLGLENFIVQLDKLQGLNVQDRMIALKEMFGAESATALAQVVGNGVDGFNKAAEVMAGQANLDQRLARILGTFDAKRDAAQGNITNTWAAVGKLFEADLKRLADVIADVSAAVGGWIEENPRLARTLFSVVGVVAAVAVGAGALALTLGVLSSGLGSVAAGMGILAAGGGNLLGALRMVAVVMWPVITATWAWTAALLANPLTWIVLGVVAAIAAVIALAAGIAWAVTHWDKFKAMVISAKDALVNAFGVAVDWVADKLQGLLSGAMQVWSDITNLFKKPLTFKFVKPDFGIIDKKGVKLPAALEKTANVVSSVAPPPSASLPAATRGASSASAAPISQKIEFNVKVDGSAGGAKASDDLLASFRARLPEIMDMLQAETDRRGRTAYAGG
jgi:TP901 family phage tail tape measure protein